MIFSRRIFLIIIFLIVGSFSYSAEKSNSGIGNLPSVSWQVTNLEHELQNKIEDALNIYIENKNYSINIGIQVNDPIKPDFYELPEGQGGDEAKIAEEAEKEIADAENEKKKEDEAAKNASVLFENVALKADSEDSIIFSKFGIEAPLIDDFNDFQPDGKILLTMESESTKNKIKRIESDFKKKELVFQEQIKELKQKGLISPVEQMWKYNSSIDVYSNLKQIDITIKLSTSLFEPIKLAVEKSIQGMAFNTGKVKPIIKFEYVSFATDLKTKEASDIIKEVVDYLSRFSFLIGIIIGVILLGLVGKGLIEKFFEHYDGTQGAAAAAPESRDKDEDEDEDTQIAPGLGSDGLASEGVWGLNGIERYKEFIKNNENEAILLVKKWIMDNQKRGNMALSAIVQQMDNNELFKVFGYLSDDEKDTWKALLDQPLNGSELKVANDYISSQIVQRIIVPNFITDAETFDLILKLDVSQLSKLIQKETAVSGLLLNVISIDYANKILNELSSKDRNRAIESAVKVKIQDFNKNLETIKKILRKYVGTFEKVPFVDRMIKLLPNAGTDAESQLFKALAKTVPEDLFKKTAWEFFPSNLILDLPEVFLKQCLVAYPMKDKVNMLFSLETDLRSQLIELFAPNGTKANDLIMVEFQNIERDPSKMKLLAGNKDEYWKNFVQFARTEIKHEKRYLMEIEQVFEVWVSKEKSSINKPSFVPES